MSTPAAPRPVGPRPSSVKRTGRSDFTALAAQVQNLGLVRRHYGYYWTKLAVLPLLLAGVIVVFVVVGESWWQLFTAAVFAVIFTQIAFLGHDAAHRQIFASGKWNDWISLLVGDLLVGMSYGWWRHKHTRHHANPNKIGSDPDIEVPVAAITPQQATRRRGSPAGWIMSHQGAFFFPILLLEGISLHASSVARLMKREPVEHRWVGVYMGASFAPNHKRMPLVPATMKLDFLRRQALMSRNVRGGRWVDTFMGGLNYQIEHHLFPSMPRPHLRLAAPIVRAYCAASGVTYTETTLAQSYAIVLRYINRVGLGERDPFVCPLAAGSR